MPEVQKELKKDTTMVDLDTTGNAVDVEIKDSKAAIKEVETKKDEPIIEVKEEKDEREEYSEGVKKRIDRLTYKIREAERREKEAVNYAQQVKGERDNLQTKFDKLDDGYVNEFTGRVKSQLEAAKVNLKQAMSKGDVDAQIAANQTLAKLAIEEERIKATEDQRKKYEESLKNAGQIGEQPVQSKAPTPKPDPKAEQWAEKNEWFGKDEAMTYASFGIHKRLVEEDGFNPTSDEYYEEIDKRIRKEFPHKFNGEEKASSKPCLLYTSPSPRD